MNFTPFPELTSERLFLRQIAQADSDVILFLRSDKAVNKYIERPESRKTKNKADAIKFITGLHEAAKNNKSISWGITLKNNPEIIGTICLWNFSENNKTAEIGYDLNPLFHKKGIMNEALKQVIDFGFKQLKLQKIEAFTHFKNQTSKKLLINNGFHLMDNRSDEDNPANVIFEINNPQTNTI